MASEGKLHIAMLPWLAFGHILPYLELAKFITQKGHKVSFISTTRNIERLREIAPNLSSLITLVKLTLPTVDHLPAGAEATMDIKTADHQYLKKAADGLEPELTQFLKKSRPDWIIYDFFAHWLSPVAGKLGISRAYFTITSAWFLAFLGPSSEAMIDGSDPRKNPEDFAGLPEWIPFPTSLAYRRYETDWLIGAGQANASGISDIRRGGLTFFGSDVFFVRQCFEFGPEWLKLLEKLHRKPVILAGLMPPTVHDRGDENHAAIEWLNRQKKHSVVYIALGSELILSQYELTELALGLELSERVKGRGLVWTSWVPQLKILSHESVGGYLNHSGWSSCIEALAFGQPLIMLTFFVDHGLNARFFAEKEVGIEVPRNEEDGSFTRDSVAESVRMVMLEDKGTSYREKAREMSGIFGDKDLQDRYADNLIKYLENHRK
ncbi:hypothetical protein LguiB_004213 [Lonicera macranthoides]